MRTTQLQETELETQVQERLIATLYDNGLVATISVVVGVVLLFPVYGLSDQISASYLTWVLVMLIGVGIRLSLVLERRYFRGIPYKHWEDLYLVASLILGMAWASIGFLVMPFGSRTKPIRHCSFNWGYGGGFAATVLITMDAACLCSPSDHHDRGIFCP